VIIAGLLILLTGWSLADPLVSLFIAVLITRGAWGVLREAVHILMEAAPRGLDVQQLVRDVASLPSISDVHDLHVWSIAGGMNALSAHILVRDDCPLSDCDGLLNRVNRVLSDRYQITHTTIQFEYDCCGRHDSDEFFCTQSEHERVDSICEHQRGSQAVGPPPATLTAQP
jgi:cobalt-zinc-cadmium efflux system protein